MENKNFEAKKSTEQQAVEVRQRINLKKKQQHDARVERLIEQAETAFLNGRLTLPQNDNAYDRFSAVLMLDRGNKYAQRGMHRILLAYVARVYQALARGDIARSNALLATAKLHYPNDPLVLGLTLKVTEARKSFAEADAKAEKLEVESGQKVLLPIDSLNQKGTAVELILIDVAERVRGSDEGVMIYARTDAEGRWIYRSMKKAAGDYRIRGDIRIHHRPAIVFMAPLAEADFSD